MRIFIARHGKTFGDDQLGGKKELMAGSRQDLPLVAEGREQAVSLAKYFQKNDIKLSAIYANDLQRVWGFAQLVKENLNAPEIQVLKDQRLIELDYGAWGGLETSKENNEVIKQFGESAWNQWQRNRLVHNFPPHNWSESQVEIETRLRDFFKYLQSTHQADETVLAVGSQGSITFINSLLPGKMPQAIIENRIKVSPGNICEFKLTNGELELVAWNQKVSP